MLDKKYITGGLNSDDDDRVIPNGDYRYALNMRLSKSDEDSEGAGENTKGNTIYSYQFPDGYNKCIGALNYTVNNKVYFFVYNSNLDHTILEFNILDKELVLIGKSILFNFKKTKLILDPFVLSGVLHFNDTENPPRSLNIAYGKLNHSSLILQDIESVKYAPNKPPSTRFRNSLDLNVPDDRKTNNVRNKLFQFTYKYIYEDNEESAWSPYSKIALPEDETSFKPYSYYPTSINNVIVVNIKIDGNRVKSIKIAAREGNTRDFFLVEDIDVDSLINKGEYSFNFFNDEVYIPLDNSGDAGMRLFDNVPLKSEAQSLIDGNRKVYAGVTEGFDYVKLNVNVNPSYEELSRSLATGQKTTKGDSAPDLSNTETYYLGQSPGYYGNSALGNSDMPSEAVRAYNNSSSNNNVSAPFYAYVNKAPSDVSLGVSLKEFPVTQFTRGFTGTNANDWYFLRSVSVEIPLPSSVLTNIKRLRFRNFHINPNGFHYELTGINRTYQWFHGIDENYYTASGILYNEIQIGKPDGVGTRYAIKIKLQYVDVGYSNSIYSIERELQYTSVLGDTATTVGNALIGIIRSSVDMFRPNNRNVFLNLGETRTGSPLTGTPLDSGNFLIQIFGEGFVPDSGHLQQNRHQPFSGYAYEDFHGNKYTPYKWTRQIDTISEATPALTSMTTDIHVYSSWTSGNNKTLKSGATHGVGFVYYDEANRSGLTNIKEKSFYVPFFTERNLQSNKIPSPTGLDIEIYHKPPSWARSYQVVYTGNKTIEKIPTVQGSGYNGFIQTRINDYQFISKGKSRINIKYLFDYNDDTPEDFALTYSFNKGDRLRFITKALTPNLDNDYDYLTDYSEVEIISYDEITKDLIIKEPPFAPEKGSLIEIYTPKKKNESDIYYEIGEVFDIKNGLHKGFIDQTQSSPCTLKIRDIGDVYLRYRTNPINFLVEDYRYSDYYESDVWDKGRGNIFDKNIGRSFKKTTIRYSDPFIEGTKINGVSEFNDLSFNDYDSKHGIIRAIESIDKNLIVYQQLKVGIVGVNQNTLYDNEGAVIGQIGSDTKVLSDIRYYSKEYGISNNPESKATYGDTTYFTDAKRGVVLRRSSNGLFPISEYKMHNHFTDTFGRLNESTSKFKAIGVYDVRFGEYILSFQEEDILIKKFLNGYEYDRAFPIEENITIKDDVSLNNNDIPTENTPVIYELGFNNNNNQTENTLAENTPIKDNVTLSDDSLITPPVKTPFTFDDGTESFIEDIIRDGKLTSYILIDSGEETFKETIAFSEKKNRWTTIYSYIPEMMIPVNIGLISFDKGQIYTHNTNSTFNNFYGEQFTSIIKLVSNKYPNNIKFYTNITVDATVPFAIIEATTNTGQKTSLIVEDFIDFESVFKAALLMDENTPNVANPLFEGDNMRGNSLVITLECTSDDFVKLFSVGVGLGSSELSNR